MNNLEVQPSEEFGQMLKSQYPKPGFIHLLNRFYPALIAGVVITALFILHTPSQKTVPEAYSPVVYSLNEYDSVSEPVAINLPDSGVSTGLVDSSSRIKGKVKHIYTYDKHLMFPVTGESSFVKASEGIHVTFDGSIMEANTNEYGEYYVVFSRENVFDTVHLKFISIPDIFTIRDTTICGLQFTGLFRKCIGEWIQSDGLYLQDKGDQFTVRADTYGSYCLIRSNSDSCGNYTDSLTIRFIPEAKISYELISPALCYGDDVKLRLIAPDPAKTKAWLNRGDITRDSNGICVLDPDYSGDKPVICYFSYTDKYCSVSDSIIIELPEKPAYELQPVPANCNEPGRIELHASHQDDLELVLADNTENYTIDRLSPGSYDLFVIDDKGCRYGHTVEVENEGDIIAEFEVKMSLDGMSVQTIDKSRGVDEYAGNLRYEWYMNGKFVSDMQQPVLDMNEISNTIRLRVYYGNNCFDEYVMNDVRPDHDLIRCANFFTPNSDGQNDEFRVILDPRLVDFKAVIMNRAGNLIYEWNDPEMGWDGKIIGGEYAAESVYFYVIQAFDSTGSPVEKRGTIQLIRD